jgi:hypothetical protein
MGNLLQKPDREEIGELGIQSLANSSQFKIKTPLPFIDEEKRGD